MSTFVGRRGGGGGGGGVFSISVYDHRHIMSTLERYHENIGRYHDSYGGYASNRDSSSTKDINFIY